MKLTSQGARLLVALCVLAGGASAAVVSFDISPGSSQIGITSYTQNGFQFTASAGVFSMRDYNPPAGQYYFFFGSADSALPPGVPLTRVDITRVGGGTFDLISVSEINDAAGVSAPGLQHLATNLGGSKDLEFNVPNIPFPADFSATLPGFAGITTLSFVEDSRSVAAYNHFSFRVTDVPEPGSAALLGLGAVVLLAARRRR